MYRLEVFNADGTTKNKRSGDLRTLQWAAVRALTEGHTVRLGLQGARKSAQNPIFYLAPMGHEDNMRRVFAASGSRG